MSKQDRISEFKIGLFVLAAIGLFVFAILRMDVVKSEPRKEFKAHFSFTGGLDPGADVQMAGVPIGQVKSLKIVRSADGTTGVDVVSEVKTDVVIPADSLISVSTHGLLGTKYLEISPGMKGALAPDAVLSGTDPVQIDAMIASGERMARKIEHTVDLVNAMVEDEDFRSTLKSNGENITALVKELRQAAQSMNQILDGVKNGRGLVGKILTDETLFQDAKDLMSDLKRNPWKLWKK
jgi:phospholipid/cholesterol/gamma-HCH transport system substrate-binding protein